MEPVLPWNNVYNKIEALSSTSSNQANSSAKLQDMYNNPDVNIPTRTMQMAAVVVASAPIIAVYPFVQKHFVKGMLLGSIKG